MAATYKSNFLKIMKSQEKRLTTMFFNLHADIMRIVDGFADADGIVPRQNMREVQTRVGNAVEERFVGYGPNGDKQPFVQLPTGEIFPLAPFSSILFTHIDRGVRLAVEQHSAMMRKYFDDDFVRFVDAVGGSAVFEFAWDANVAELNPFAQYQASHEWVDPNGYRLSDRIWNVSNAERRRLDMYLEEAIREGRSSRQMGRELEQFLIPGRSALQTSKPYGTKASYDAMRLARTETTRAHASASEQAALDNPFVSGIGIRLSGSHPKADICDEAAAASPFPKDDVPFEYRIPLHPHCLCTYKYEITSSPRDVALEEQQAVRQAKKRLIDVAGPMLVDAYVKRLLQGEVTRLLPNDVASPFTLQGAVQA